jgi:hypothetical protein
LYKKLHDWVQDEREQLDEDDEDVEREWRDAHKSLGDMEGYVEGFTDGEFVPCKLYWNLEEVVLTKAPKANRKCECELVSDSEPETEEVQDSKSAKESSTLVGNGGGDGQ